MANYLSSTPVTEGDGWQVQRLRNIQPSSALRGQGCSISQLVIYNVAAILIFSVNSYVYRKD
jgi:hypothetical protein